LIGLTPVKKGDPTPEPPPSGKAPVVLGQFTLGGLDPVTKKVLSPVFTAAGGAISFADVTTTPDPNDASAPPTRKATPVTGSLKFSEFVTGQKTPPDGEISVLPGDIKISTDGARNVSTKTKVNYSLFAVMGDPGATTFYTVKNAPVSPEEQKKADQAAAIAAAKKSAKQSTSGAILSLFS
jgi:hypothetical protein